MFERRRVVYTSSTGPGGFGLDLSLTPWVKRLLIANTAVFLAMALGLLPPAWAVRTFGFAAPELLVHPWSPVTYMFLHGGFWHLFMNMLAVFFFGPPLERKWGGRFFAKYYLVAGLGGALFSLLLYPVIGASLMIGASGAVFGLLLAFAMNWPDAPIYIWGILPIRAKWFVGILGFFALFATISGSGDGVAHWAHLGGLATGYVYLRHGGRFGRNLSRLIWKEATPEIRSDVEVVRGRQGASSRSRPGRRRGGRGEGDALDRVDQILDKIREAGIDSLSAEERAFLDDMSRRYREGPERTFH